MKNATFSGCLVWFFLFWSFSVQVEGKGPSQAQDLGKSQKALLVQVENGLADESVMVNLLDVSLKLDDLTTTIDWGRKAVEKFPKNPLLKIRLADALQRKMNKMPMTWMSGKGEYIDLLEAAIALDPKSPEPYLFLNGFYLGAPGFVGGSAEKALDVAQRLRKHDEVEGSLALAQVYLKQGNEQAWRDTFSGLLEKQSDPRIHYRFGMALQQIEAYDEALPQFGKAADQGHPDSMYQSGRTRVLGKFQWKEAIAEFDRFLAKVEGTDHGLIAGAWWRKGQAYEALGELARAKDCLEKALVVEPEMKNAQKDLARISKKSGD